ncbi:MAG TPA: protein kinase [Bryobacteraceae bacterium]|nr:protein kinase [Bryobacteraceae bacterium]
MPLAAASRLGPYEIVSLIGAGGMGEVYRARDPRLQRDVAIKVLPGALQLDADRRARFEQEARAAGALNHPNIVAIYDIGLHDGALYIVQELLEGETLRERLRQGPLPARKAIDCAVQTARGLAAAHAKGIVHRDLKPDNLFLTRDGRLKILDFGLAKLTSRPAALSEATSAPTEVLGTQPGLVLGTIGYMSPEQVRGQPVDHRSDIFCLGAILFEAVTGRRAFQAESSVETMSAILKDEPPELASINPGLPGGLDRIVRHCLEKNPEERFHSARDLAFDLESLSTASSGARAAVSPAAPPRRKRLLVPLVAAAAVVLAFFAGGMLLPRAAPDLAQYRFTALATEEGGKSYPAWSPDGQVIAYSAQVDGVYQIFTRGTGEAASAQLTKSAADCVRPFWSPDGTRIFYFSRYTPRSLWEVGAAGGVPQERLPGILTADISPDGKVLAFARTSREGTNAVWVQLVDGSQPRKLGSDLSEKSSEPDAFLRFSPDGAHIGIWSSVAETAHFWLLSYPQGSATRTIEGHSTARGDWEYTFSWFPDSRHILFSGALPESGADHLLVADTRTGAVQAITNGLNFERKPAVSPDGQRIAFASGNVYAAVVEVPLDGSPVRNIVATSGHAHCACWSPAGDQFAYDKDHNGVDEIWIRSALGGWERPLITRASFHQGPTDRVTEPSYSPDGQRIAFVRVSGGRRSVWLTSIAGGLPVPFVQGDSSVPAWSPDGNWIVYMVPRNGRYTLWKTPAGGGQPVQVFQEDTPSDTRPKWSPRGDWITWVNEKGLKLVSPDGAKTVLLSDNPDWFAVGFSKDGLQVLGIRLNQAHHLVAASIDLATKRERIISDLGPSVNVHAFSLAPDGKSFLTSMVRGNLGDIWLLDGFPQPAQLFGKWHTLF